MSIKKRFYAGGYGYSADFERIRQFLIRINEETVVTPNFLWGRWEWMHTLPYMNKEKTDKIGVWEDSGKIIGLVTYEDDVGDAYFCVDPAYGDIKEEMFCHAAENLCKEGRLRALISDMDGELKRIARRYGFVPTQNRQYVAEVDIDFARYMLREGFSVISINEGFEVQKFNRLLHRGFNHEGPAPEDEESLSMRRRSVSSPNTVGELNILITAPNGDYAAYCGLWHTEGSAYALVEPVCTDPDYRRMGCGRAAVSESVLRAGRRGAKKAYVGSAQQFYYSIGFAPAFSETWWEAHKNKS